jgi:16S rRNA (cytosine1402-N4)-methyltransferase
MNYHQPVLLDSVKQAFNIKPKDVVIDGTLGHGGHTLYFLSAGATVFAIDQDPESIKIATDRIKNSNLEKNFIVINDNFSNILSVCKKNKISKADYLFLDLGLSNLQQTSQNRGFSFNDKLSLDMRLNPQKQTVTAEYLINTASEEELFTIFSKYAQERLSRPLSQYLIRQRQKKPIKTGQELAFHIKNYFDKKQIKTRLNPATKIFLALRIVVNQEFSSLEKFLTDSLKIIKKNGTIGIISFSSGEDRLVKNFIRQHHFVSQKYSPSRQEISQNPLSRSAILRVFTV